VIELESLRKGKRSEEFGVDSRVWFLGFGFLGFLILALIFGFANY